MARCLYISSHSSRGRRVDSCLSISHKRPRLEPGQRPWIACPDLCNKHLRCLCCHSQAEMLAHACPTSRPACRRPCFPRLRCGKISPGKGSSLSVASGTPVMGLWRGRMRILRGRFLCKIAGTLTPPPSGRSRWELEAAQILYSRVGMMALSKSGAKGLANRAGIADELCSCIPMLF